MYGMIHQAFRDLFIERAGAAAWQEFERELGIGPADLISAMVYPDEETEALLAAGAQRLGQDLPDCLRDFGRHWVRFAGSGAYSGIMDFVGNDFPRFIANLDRMHRAVQVAMPEARVPAFTLLGVEGNVVRVGYRSSRAGLETFVEGLLGGLLERFALHGSVSLAGTAVDHGSTSSEFRVDLTPP